MNYMMMPIKNDDDNDHDDVHDRMEFYEQALFVSQSHAHITLLSDHYGTIVSTFLPTGASLIVLEPVTTTSRMEHDHDIGSSTTRFK
jgi:hypothetical protein